jgi:hypothetical protein
VIRLICVLLVWLVAVDASAHAQTPTPTPEPAPAPKTPQRREPPQTMMLTMSLSESDADDAMSGDTASLPVAGFHTDADAMVTYRRKKGRATISAVGRSVVRYAPASQALTTAYDQGQLSFSMVTAHNRFEGSQLLSYSPYYQFGALPDATPSPLTETAQSHGDFANSTLRAFGSTTGLDFARTISRRDTLSFSYNLRRTTFSGRNLDLTYQASGALFLHQITRSVALRAGYEYRSTNSTFTQRGFALNHNLDLGLDYNRALGFSKRTTLSFVSGAAATPTDYGTIINPTGNAALTRQIGRTWRTRLAVSRSVELLEGFTQPLLTNNALVDVGGKLNRRASVSASAGYSMGVVGMAARNATSYENWSGTIGLRLMLSRWTALQTQYSSYGHRFDQGVQLAPGVASGLRRQGLRVSFTWLRPVLHGTERMNP